LIPAPPDDLQLVDPQSGAVRGLCGGAGAEDGQDEQQPEHDGQ